MDLENVCHNFLNKIFAEFKLRPEKTKCIFFVKKKSVRVGCQNIALENNYCIEHQSNAPSVGLIAGLMETNRSAPTKAVAKKQATATKAREEIEHWLKTAIPQRETVLKRCAEYLLDDFTELVFNDDFTVFGKLSKDKIIKLSQTDVETCERNGWRYDMDAVAIQEET